MHCEVHCMLLWQKRVSGIHDQSITGQRQEEMALNVCYIIHCLLYVGVWMERYWLLEYIVIFFFFFLVKGILGRDKCY